MVSLTPPSPLSTIADRGNYRHGDGTGRLFCRYLDSLGDVLGILYDLLKTSMVLMSDIGTDCKTVQID